MKRFFNRFFISILLVISMLFSFVPSTVVVVNSEENDTSSSDVQQVSKGDLKIYFFSLGNFYDGDSCIISIGDVQILVDAGSMPNSAEQIGFAIEDVIDHHDLCWDYVIATHADSDHISAFSTNESIEKDNGVLKKITTTKTNGAIRKIGTFIDFDVTKDETVDSEIRDRFKRYWHTDCYKKYANRRDEYIKDKTITQYFTASQCCWKQRGLAFGLGTNEFILSAGPNPCKLKILYNYYYDHDPKGASDSAKKNALSVCFLIEYGQDKFLFTGDLGEYDSGLSVDNIDEQETEEIACCNNTGYKEVGGFGNGGETLLLKNNPELESGVSFYKLAHHGSKTSSSVKFINAIKPKIAVCPATAGSPSHRHSNSLNSSPSKVVLDNILSHTDYILTPSQSKYKTENCSYTREDYYGKILITSSGEGVKAYSTNECEENGEKVMFADQVFCEPKPITETKWYKLNREEKLSTYVFSGFVSESEVYLGNCTLLKYGSLEILIDCGVYETGNMIKKLTTTCFIDKIKEYCTDGVLEYVIVTSSETGSISQMVDPYKDNQPIGKGIFSQFTIDHLIDFGNSYDPSNNAPNSLFGKYNQQKNDGILAHTIKKISEKDRTREQKAFLTTMKTEIKEYFGPSKAQDDSFQAHFEVTKDISLEILKNDYYESKDNKLRFESGLFILVNYHGEQLLFTGNVSSVGEKELVSENHTKLSNVTFFLATDYGKDTANSEQLLKAIRDNDLYIVVNTIWGYVKGHEMLPNSVIKKLKTYSNNIYVTLKKQGSKCTQVCGDITFELAYKNRQIKRNIKGSSNTVNLDSISGI